MKTTPEYLSKTASALCIPSSRTPVGASSVLRDPIGEAVGEAVEDAAISKVVNDEAVDEALDSGEAVSAGTGAMRRSEKLKSNT